MSLLSVTRGGGDELGDAGPREGEDAARVTLGALRALDGSTRSAVSLLTGLSAGELDELGGVAP